MSTKHVSINNVLVAGNTTDAAKEVANGKGAKLTVAVNRRYEKDGETKEVTSFFDVVTYREKIAEKFKGINKGTFLVVTGELSQLNFETQEGEKRSVLFIKADNVTKADAALINPQITLSGRAVEDAKNLGESGALATLAYNKNVKREDGGYDSYPTFVDVKSFRYAAKDLAQVKKGDLVVVDGSLQQDKWETEDGKKQSKLAIYANQVGVVASKGEAGNGENSSDNATDNAEQGFDAPMSDDDIPF